MLSLKCDLPYYMNSSSSFQQWSLDYLDFEMFPLAVYTSKVFQIHSKDRILGLLKSLGCTSENFPIN